MEAGIEAPIVYIPATMSPTTYSACLTPTASILTSRAMSFEGNTMYLNRRRCLKS